MREGGKGKRERGERGCVFECKSEIERNFERGKRDVKPWHG